MTFTYMDGLKNWCHGKKKTILVITCLIALQLIILIYRDGDKVPNSYISTKNNDSEISHNLLNSTEILLNTTNMKPALDAMLKNKNYINESNVPLNELKKNSQNMSSLPEGEPPYCPIIPPGLEGPVIINYSLPTYEALKKAHPKVHTGGRWQPLNCTARNRVAIIVPYRNREEHLRLFLQHLHPFLQKQQISYGIYVVEMALPTKFNRATLLNIGAVEAKKDFPWQCYIFHDVDMLPEDDHNIYSCPHIPRHMAHGRSLYNYTLRFPKYAGGVLAISVAQFEQINGFSNEFFGWGSEDDDFYRRIMHNKLGLYRYPRSIGRYNLLGHVQAKPSKDRIKLLNSGKKRYATDGLNSLKYETIEIKRRQLFTWIYVKIDGPKVKPK